MIPAVFTTEQIFQLSLLVLAASLALHGLSLKLFPILKLLDFPERYGLKRSRIPYPTGIIGVGLFLVVFAGLQPHLATSWSMQSQGIFLAVCLLGTVSFFDDRCKLPAKWRLLAQITVGLLVFATGTRIYSLTNPLAGVLGFDVLRLDTLVIPSATLSDPSVIGALFTVIWLGLTINALNWFDGIPGQVSMLAVIGFVTIGCLSLSARVDQPELALLSFVLAAIAAGGLLFDFPPAQLLMGDTGAMFYGLMLGILTIYAGGKVATAFLVLGVPLIDFALVIGRRLAKGASLASNNTTNEHLHHRLLAKGWSPRNVILLTAGLGSIFGISALFLSTSGKLIAGLLLFVVMLLLSRYTEK